MYLCIYILYVFICIICMYLNVFMVFAKKLSKSVTTTLRFLLEIKVKKEIHNSQNIYGS